MFIWSVPTALAELNRHAPQLGGFVQQVIKSPNVAATVNAQFPELKPISIDYALMEKASRVLNIEATFDWDDVGSWISIAKYLEKHGENNRTNKEITTIESENNIVFSSDDRRVALLGVDDLIVVQTGDAVLIANRHQADDIKKLVDELPGELL